MTGSHPCDNRLRLSQKDSKVLRTNREEPENSGEVSLSGKVADDEIWDKTGQGQGLGEAGRRSQDLLKQCPQCTTLFHPKPSPEDRFVTLSWNRQHLAPQDMKYILQPPSHHQVLVSAAENQAGQPGGARQGSVPVGAWDQNI